MSPSEKRDSQRTTIQEAFTGIVALGAHAVGGATLRVPTKGGRWRSLLRTGCVSDTTHVQSFVLERWGSVVGTLDLHLREGRSLGQAMGRIAKRLSALTTTLVGERQRRGEDIDSELACRLETARGTWRLTPRHLDVLEALSVGTANKLIADALECSEKTVEAHIAELRRRSGTSNRAELIARFWTAL